MTWDPKKNTDAENERWAHLRAIEWDSLPSFLAPLWGSYFVFSYGWIVFVITLFVLELAWKIFFRNKTPNIQFADTCVMLVAFLKWPVAIIFAVLAYISHANIIFVISLVIFPLLYLLAAFILLPLEFFFKPQVGIVQRRIMRKMGYEFSDEYNENLKDVLKSKLN